MSGVVTIVGYALREAVRRKVFLVVLVLTAGFLVLYWLGSRQLFANLQNVNPPQGIDARTLAGATVFGLSMFAALFLGTVLAVFLTLGVVRGDAERGLLQPLVVRPLGRPTLLAARFLGAAAVCAAYVAFVYATTLAITRATGHWRPDALVAPAAELVAAVILIVALSLLGSVFLSSTANGIAIFMVFGAGLVAGLLGQIGHALNNGTLRHIARLAYWVVPFEALYEDALHRITAGTRGFTRFALSLGPFGGAQAGGTRLAFWAPVYLLLVGAAAVAGFARRDL